MAALRNRRFGAGREECSFLFIVNGKGRQGLGLHHDGPVESIWVQLEGRRTVTTGPPVRPGTRQDLDEGNIGRGWKTRDLEPGSLFYMRPYMPHRVICHGRSLALSLTWKLRKRPLAGSRAAAALTSWDVAAGRAEPIPRASRDRLWTQVRFLRRVSADLRLFGARPSDTIELAGSIPARLAKSLEYPSRKDFLDDYRRRTAWVRALYDRVVPAS